MSPSITQLVILGIPFLSQLYPFSVSNKGICSDKGNLRFSQVIFPQESLFTLTCESRLESSYYLDNRRKDFFKLGEKPILVIEPTDLKEDIQIAVDKYLYENLPHSVHPKSRDWFETILNEKSAIITHHKRGTEIAYSSLKINHILSYEDWTIQPHWKNPFKDKSIFPKYYSYFDYIDAWEYTLYYQNHQQKIRKNTKY